MTIRRMKTYTGGQGYVYQYYFVGKRPGLEGTTQVPATEYVFDVTSDRKITFAVSVFVEQQALLSWAKNHGRALTDAEEYGAAKMRLFQASTRSKICLRKAAIWWSIPPPWMTLSRPWEWTNLHRTKGLSAL